MSNTPARLAQPSFAMWFWTILVNLALFAAAAIIVLNDARAQTILGALYLAPLVLGASALLTSLCLNRWTTPLVDRQLSAWNTSEPAFNDLVALGCAAMQRSRTFQYAFPRLVLVLILLALFLHLALPTLWASWFTAAMSAIGYVAVLVGYYDYTLDIARLHALVEHRLDAYNTARDTLRPSTNR